MELPNNTVPHHLDIAAEEVMMAEMMVVRTWMTLFLPELPRFCSKMKVHLVTLQDILLQAHLTEPQLLHMEPQPEAPVVVEFSSDDQRLLNELLNSTCLPPDLLEDILAVDTPVDTKDGMKA
jgi:hypothetical protein